MMELKERLIDFRARHNFTQRQAAKVLNTSREMIIAIEGDKRQPSAFMKRRIEILIDEYATEAGVSQCDKDNMKDI